MCSYFKYMVQRLQNFHMTMLVVITIVYLINVHCRNEFTDHSVACRGPCEMAMEPHSLHNEFFGLFLRGGKIGSVYVIM